MSLFLVLFLPNILIVFVQRLDCRLLKKICFWSCIIYLKSCYFLSEGKLTVETHIFAYKILLINFHLTLDNYESLQKLLLIHKRLVTRTLLKHIDQSFLFYFRNKFKLFTEYHPFVQSHYICRLSDLVKGFAAPNVTLLAQVCKCFLYVRVCKDRKNRIFSLNWSLSGQLKSRKMKFSLRENNFFLLLLNLRLWTLTVLNVFLLLRMLLLWVRLMILLLILDIFLLLLLLIDLAFLDLNSLLCLHFTFNLLLSLVFSNFRTS